VNHQTAAVLALLLGQQGPPRDSLGRFTVAGGGDDQERPAPARTAAYDGGVRQTVPAPRDPERDHAQLIVGLALARRHGGTGPFV
jgi:hypothetical protein